MVNIAEAVDKLLSEESGQEYKIADAAVSALSSKFSSFKETPPVVKERVLNIVKALIIMTGRNTLTPAGTAKIQALVNSLAQ